MSLTINQPMLLRDLIANINRCADEIGGNLLTTIASHKVAPTLTVVSDTDDGLDEIYFEVESVDLNYRFGCMCPDGIIIKIRPQKLL